MNFLKYCIEILIILINELMGTPEYFVLPLAWL